MTDLFNDLSALRLNSADSTDVSEVLVHVPVRKPNKHEFIRVHREHSLPTTVFTDKEERGEIYFVPPAMRGPLVGEIDSVVLVPAISRQATVFIWPVRLPSEDGWRNTWTTTAHKAAGLAKEQWVRLSSDRGVSGYRIYQAQGQLSEPVWPDKPFEELLDIAFKGRVIDSEEHPIIRRLRGLV